MITDEAKRVKAAAYADHVREIVKRKHTLEQKIENQRAELGLAGAALGERIDVSPSADAIPDGVARLIDMVRDYTTELAEYVDVIDEFTRAIRQLEPTHERILFLRYVALAEWQEIADELHFNATYVCDLRNVALVRLYDAMPEWWRSRAIPAAIKD